jgi:hypothetical protein
MALISRAVVGRSDARTIAESEPATTGTRIATPSNRPASAGIARVTAIAAPVEAGTMLTAAARPRRMSAPRAGASIRLWMAV